MNINPINSIKFIKKSPVFQIKTPKLNYEIKDTVSFSGKKSAKEPRVYGDVYESLKIMDTGRTRTVLQLKDALQNGEDISSDKEKLILSRIPSALKDAEDFVSQHPEFDVDDIKQDLVKEVIRATNWELTAKSKKPTFVPIFNTQKERYFSRLLKQTQREETNPRVSQYLAIQAEKQKPEEIHLQFERSELNEELKKDFKKALKHLKPRYQEFIIKRFGLDGNKPMTLEELGDECSSTRQNMRQIESCAMRDFKKAYLNIQLMKKMGGKYED